MEEPEEELYPITSDEVFSCLRRVSSGDEEDQRREFLQKLFIISHNNFNLLIFCYSNFYAQADYQRKEEFSFTIWHIQQEKSMFSLTPKLMMKKESR